MNQSFQKPFRSVSISRLVIHSTLLGVAFAFTGCATPTPQISSVGDLRKSQLHAKKLHEKNVAMQNNIQAVQTLAQNLTAEKQAMLGQQQAMLGQQQALVAQNEALSQQAMLADQRVQNLMAERQQMQMRIASLSDVNVSGGLPSGVQARFQELADRFPDFEFDPVTGVSRFREEILFSSGSDQLRSSASSILREFADILNSGEAGQLRILVAGHTDDQRIARATTHSRHQTNWHLSTNRANSVVLALKKFGMAEGRMGAVGYGKHQPLVENYDETTRQRNRRVEIYVLAPEADTIASWDPINYR